MNKSIKLLILIILSLSVYFIYTYTNKPIKVLILGDKNITFSNISVIINNKYAMNNLSTKHLLEKIKLERNIKRELIESHYLILRVGYNDLLYDFLLLFDLYNYLYILIL